MLRNCALGCIAALTALVGPAAAQGSDVGRAEALFHEAVKLMDAGKLDEACPKFADSQRLVRGLGTTLYLAACYERSGRTASAWAQFRLAESLANARGDKRAAIAHDRAEALEAALPKVKLAVAPEANVPGLEIRQDGSLVDKPEWGAELPIDPGAHSFSARAPHKTEWSTKVTIPVGKGTTTVAFPALEDEPATAES